MKSTSKSDTASSAAPFVPDRLSLPVLKKAVQACRGCELYKNATHAVFGEGPAGAKVLIIGEQPGDQEDLAGRPFVGPAGKLLDESLALAGIDRKEVFVTNAVKHFRWEPRGKRRLHKKPGARHIAACRPWLEAELELVKPRMIVTLGAVAAAAMLGPRFRLTQHRGEIQSTDSLPWILATVHPSSLLRIPDADDRRAAREAFVTDLKLVAVELKKKKRRTATSGVRGVPI